MSTGYSGNMGFKIPLNWNYDQFAEIDMETTTDGEWTIDKDAYAGKYEPVITLDSYVYVQPAKTEIPDHPTISEVLPLIEQLEDLYVAWYTPLFQVAPNTLPYLSAQVLAKGITKFLRSVAYNDFRWQITLSAADEGFVNYVKEQNPTLYNNLYPYIARENDGGILISDEHGGLIDLKHLAATAEGYFTTSIAPDSWYGWAADLATILDTEDIAENYDGYQEAADIVVGNSNYSFSFEDICSDADAIKVAELVSESSSTTHSFSEALSSYFNNYVNNRFYYLLGDIDCAANLTAIKEKLVGDLRVITAAVALLYASDTSGFKETLESIPSSEAYTACCSSFANYIYCEIG